MNLNNIIRPSLYILAILLFVIHSHSMVFGQAISTNPPLQDGDLLFQDLDCGPLCEAIEKVTNGVDNKDFSHVGMVFTRNDTVWVIEATGGKGVCSTSLESFYNRSKDERGQPKIVVGRLKKKYRHLIPGAIDFAIKQLNLPYDEEFLPENGKYYCSELIYDAFRHVNKGVSLFDLQPMTFIDPETGLLFPAWETYYKALNKEVPEGLPGCNPGGISRSKHIKIIKSYY